MRLVLRIIGSTRDRVVIVDHRKLRPNYPQGSLNALADELDEQVLRKLNRVSSLGAPPKRL